MPRVASEAAAHVGARVAEQRRKVGLTQDQLAAASSIDSSNIRAYESGRSMPNVQSLVRIATALGIEPGDLLTGLTPDLFTERAEDGRRRPVA